MRKQMPNAAGKIPVKAEMRAMSTVITHQAFGGDVDAALQAATCETLRLEKALSRFIPDSEIRYINRLAGQECVKVSDDTYEVLSRAAIISARSRGIFDATIGPLVDLWSKAKEASKPPDESEIKAALSLVNHPDLLLDSYQRTAGLKRPGQSLDLGGIGKGFAADKVLETLKRFDVTSAFTNFGGNVAAMGARPDGSPWRVGIRHPRDENGLVGVVSVTGRSVVTSGDYQRYFMGTDGKRYHHILNPATGRPSESGLTSATVVTDSSMEADALSTVLFIAGMDMGLEILKSFPGAEAVFIDDNMTAYVTTGLNGSFQAAEGVNWHIL